VKSAKQYKIWRTACHFLHFHGGQDQASRFDVISIDFRKGTLDIQYYPGAFETKATLAHC
jgi:putative endonuclease